MHVGRQISSLGDALFCHIWTQAKMAILVLRSLSLCFPLCLKKASRSHETRVKNTCCASNISQQISWKQHQALKHQHSQSVDYVTTESEMHLTCSTQGSKTQSHAAHLQDLLRLPLMTEELLSGV